MSQKHLLISAAGTGGHVMPGLAVARELARRGWRISWIGTQTGMEGALVARDGIAFTGLDFQGVRGKGLLGMVKGMVKLVLASRRATEVIRTMKPMSSLRLGATWPCRSATARARTTRPSCS